MNDEEEFLIIFRPMWEKCDCDDYWCHLHGEHAHDCVCPPLDFWLEQHDKTPYDIKVPVIYAADDPFILAELREKQNEEDEAQEPIIENNEGC